MKLYRTPDGRFHRTKTGLKPPFEQVDVPTDHKGLTEFLNNLVPATEPEPEELIVTSPDQLPPYKNGDPTRVFMGSRNPIAIFTCIECGKLNRNQAT